MTLPNSGKVICGFAMRVPLSGRNNEDRANDFNIPAQSNLDANVIWKPAKNLEIMLAGQNLLEPSQLQYVAELITPPTEIERVVYMKVTWNF
jgi:hypothetical protein